MVDTVRIGGGSILKMSTGGSPFSYITIAEVESIGALTQQRPEIKATPLAASAERYIGGLKDGQSSEISIFLKPDDATQNASTGVQAAFNANEQREFIVCPPVGISKQFRFAAVITNCAIGPFNAGEAMHRSITIRLASDIIEENNTNV